MNENDGFIRAYSLADLFDRTFAMIRRTWKTSLLVGAIAFVVPSLLLGWAVLRMMDNLVAFAQTVGPDPGLEALWPIVRIIGIAPLAGALMGLAYLFAYLVVVDAVRAEATEGSHAIGSSAIRALRTAFLPVLGQVIVKGLVFGVITAAPLALIVLVVGITQSGAALVLLAVLVYLAAIVITIWLFISWFFSGQAVVFDDQGALAGLGESLQIVRANWWRAFGFYVLMQVLFSFLLGIITTPFVGLSLLPGLGRIIQASQAAGLTDAEALRIMSSFSGLGVATMLGAFIQQLVSVLFLPVYYSLLFVDLKVRSGHSFGTQTAELG